jgi:hypothetical protein
MIGIILIYFLGKAFYELAQTSDKNKWLFAVLGVLAYYLGTFLGGIILVLIEPLTGFNAETANEFLIGFLALPFGLLTAYAFYRLLKYHWTKQPIATNEELLDL